MDIIQGVLGRRLPLVSSVRMDIPDVISKIIQKMTAKNIEERYHSASGLRYDLSEVRRLLGAGEAAALKNWPIATKDISSFFILPSIMIGRSEEHDEVVKIIDKVSRRHIMSQTQDPMSSLSSGSTLSEGRLESFDAAMAVGDFSDDNTSSAEGGPSNSLTNNIVVPKINSYRSNSSHLRSTANSQHNSAESIDGSKGSGSILRPWDSGNSVSFDARSFADSMSADGTPKSNSDAVGSLTHHRNTTKFNRKGRCEVISISGAAGLGKSCLVQSVHLEARRRGYFASKFYLSASESIGIDRSRLQIRSSKEDTVWPCA